MFVLSSGEPHPSSVFNSRERVVAGGIDQGICSWRGVLQRCTTPLLCIHLIHLDEMTTLNVVPVNATAVRQKLKKLNITTTMLAALCGYADPASINYHLRRGVLPAKVVDYCANKFDLDLAL